MPTMPIPTVTTAEQLLVLRDPPWQHELWRGELRRMSPAGFDHGDQCLAIALPLRAFVASRRIGRVVGNDVGFVLARNPDTVLAPDVAFVRAERVPDGGVPGFFEGPPDVAAEVRSPHDSKRAFLAKAGAWLAHGTRWVWSVDPRQRIVIIHRASGTTTTLRGDDVLTGEEELAGFRLPLLEIFVN